jgi:hypothetical protein
MPKIADLIDAAAGELGRSDAVDALDPRTRAQNQMAHGMLGLGLSLPVAVLCGDAWAALAVVLVWAVAEGWQIVTGPRWRSRQGWDSLADLGGWLSGWLIACLVDPAAPVQTASAGAVALLAGPLIGFGYWMKFGSRNPA